MWHTCKMENYLAKKKKRDRYEVLLNAATWINLEKIMLSEIIQPQKPNIVLLKVYDIQNRRIYGNKLG